MGIEGYYKYFLEATTYLAIFCMQFTRNDLQRVTCNHVLAIMMTVASSRMKCNNIIKCSKVVILSEESEYEILIPLE